MLGIRPEDMAQPHFDNPVAETGYDIYGNPDPSVFSPAVENDTPLSQEELAMNPNLTQDQMGTPDPVYMPDSNQGNPAVYSSAPVVGDGEPEPYVDEMSTGGPGGPVEDNQQLQPQEQQRMNDPNAAFGYAMAGLAQADPRGLYGSWGAQAAGLGAGAARYQSEMAKLRSGVGVPSSIKEYEYAKGEGYEGSFAEYKKEFGHNAFSEMMQMMNYRAGQAARADAGEDRATVRENTEANRKFAREDRKINRKNTEANRKLIDEDRDAAREDRLAQQDLRNEERVARVDREKARRIDSQTQKLDKSISQELLDIQNALTDIRQSTAKYQPDTQGNIDIPGFGKLEGAVPEKLGGLLGNDAVQMRANVAKLRNVILSARSGAAVTTQEAERLLAELGMGGGRDEKIMLRQLNKVQASLNEMMKRRYAGYSDEVVQNYLGAPYQAQPPVYSPDFLDPPATGDVDDELRKRGIMK